MGGEWKENTEEAGMKNAFRADASCGIVLNHVQGGAMAENITQLAEPQTTNYDERWKMIL